MSKQEKHKKVYVGLSGGVDSSVSLALLKEQGFDVVGVFIKIWEPDFLDCTWKSDRLDAMRVASALEVPFKTIDLSDVYKKEVVDYMIREYKAGRTPNPDVFCNKKIKFGAFLAWAKRDGAHYVATGHYAKCAVAIEGGKKRFVLKASTDQEKDQTYFLWQLSQDELRSTLFPIGDMKKSEVRKKAQNLNLFTAKKKDSQGLCFVGKVAMKDFLKTFITTSPGEVCNESGEVIGWHEGAELYTLGERHGFTITKKTPSDKPYYVINKNLDANRIMVSSLPKKKEERTSSFLIESVNWISGIPPQDGYQSLARIRYRAPLVSSTIYFKDSTTTVSLRSSEIALPTPGQSIVFYTDTGECLGGGIIA